MKDQEVVAVVGQLNDEIARACKGGTSYRPFVAIFDGQDQAVKCFGLGAWCSDEDERDDGQPLESFLREWFNDFRAEVSEAKL